MTRIEIDPARFWFTYLLLSGLTLPFFKLQNGEDGSGSLSSGDSAVVADGVQESGSLPNGDTVYSIIISKFGFPFGNKSYDAIFVRFPIPT